MPSFTYTAINQQGARIKGLLTAANQVAALDQLAVKGLTPVQLKEGGTTEPWWNRDIALFGATSWKPAELETFFAMLSAMLMANTPLPRALRFCADLSTGRQMKIVLQNAISAVEDGAPLADALSQGDRSFPERLVAMVRLGEASNSLNLVVERAASMLETEAMLRRQVQQALIYPIILLCMSVFVIGVLVFYLAPTLAPVFATADASPPFIIDAMVRIEETLSSQWPTVIIIFAAFGIIGFAVKELLGKATYRLLMVIPTTRDFLAKRETLRLCQTLFLMLSSGGQLTDAIKTAAQTSTYANWRKMLTKAHSDIEAGATLTDALLQNALIDPMARTILATGEESDQLVRVLEPTIATLQTQTSQTLSQTVKLLTPLLTLVIGLLVGAIILSTISAIMDLNDVAF